MRGSNHALHVCQPKHLCFLGLRLFDFRLRQIKRTYARMNWKTRKIKRIWSPRSTHGRVTWTCRSTGSTQVRLQPPPRERLSSGIALPLPRSPVRSCPPTLSQAPQATSPTPSDPSATRNLPRSLVPCRRVGLREQAEVLRKEASRVEEPQNRMEV